MKHEVDSWVQATSPSHREEESMPANLSPFTDSPPQSASTHAPLSRLQPIAVTAPEVRDEEACLTIGGAEDLEDPRWCRTRTPKVFPLPSGDSVHTLDRDACEDRPSPYLTRRCPVCFSASGAKSELSRYVLKIVRASAYKQSQCACYRLSGRQLFPTSSPLSVQGPDASAPRLILDLSDGR